jgi:hypothetical protein
MSKFSMKIGSQVKKLAYATLTIGLLFSFSACKPNKPSKKNRRASNKFAPAVSNSNDAQANWTPSPVAPVLNDQGLTPLTGCLKEQPIQQMDILINGAIASPVVVNNKSSNPWNNQGIPGQMTFEFNGGFAHTEVNAYGQLMKNQGKITTRDLSSYKVEQIKYIRITLGGHAFRSIPFEDYSFWKGPITKFRISDASRFAMNTVSIVVNGKELYKRGALNVTLDSRHRSWEDLDLASNLVTQNVMEEPCEAVILPVETEPLPAENDPAP